MKEFDRFSFPRNYSGKVPLFFRKFPEKFRRKFPEISEITTLVTCATGNFLSNLKFLCPSVLKYLPMHCPKTWTDGSIQ